MPGKKWISGAIGKPGALRGKVKRRYGSKGFTRRGTIKKEVLVDMSKEPGTTGKQARLGLTLRKMKRQ